MCIFAAGARLESAPCEPFENHVATCRVPRSYSRELRGARDERVYRLRQWMANGTDLPLRTEDDLDAMVRRMPVSDTVITKPLGGTHTVCVHRIDRIEPILGDPTLVDGAGLLVVAKLWIAAVSGTSGSDTY